ncbi:glycerophosphodiester phosphodiesterase [Vibrio hippocampi]|uniref:GP-PDE domain-containing protein n=1 Tax=Vibrio hippocampi TaxID=654686 RepID=A0ABN8DDB0_9VIBR|nr:glycerophosphodiester phosphodiesterase family protein [Vibrio hippocampi]CAH0524895.1 hypothetical protein VHP8226_00570 [Vibrio hippocampi]
MNFRRLLVLVGMLSLVGCASTSSDSTQQTKDDSLYGLSSFPMGAEGRAMRQSSFTDQQVVDIQLALQTRGLYWTAGQTPAYLDNQCSVNVYAHRGHYNYPENSVSALIMGVFGGFDGVEIDVMLTRDGYWVVHHDSQTGRATGRSDGKRYKMSRIKGKEWNSLVVRDKDGRLTNERAPYLVDVLEPWRDFYYRGQQLNIEIKQDADISELAALNRIVTSKLPKGSYFYSSLNFEVLELMRQIDANVYLGYVWEPHPTSIAKAKQTAKKAVRSDDLYQKYQRQIGWVSDYEYRRRTRKASKKYSARTVKKALGSNSGLHVDIRSYMDAPTIQSRSKQAGLARVATYTINGTEYHQQALVTLKQRGRALPDEVIMDTSQFEICHRLNPTLKKQAKHYTPTTEYGRAIMKLPNNADFTRLQEQVMYVADNHYLTYDGRVRSLTPTPLRSSTKTASSSKKTSSSTSSAKPALSSIFIPVDEEMDLESTPIIITVPQ